MLKKSIVRGCVILLAAASLSACSPKSTVIPSDPQKWDTIAPDIKRLSDEDRRLAGAYMLRHSIAGAFNQSAGIPPGTTLGDAIKEQKKFEADMKMREAEAAALKAKVLAERAAVEKKIGEVATVSIVDVRVIPEDIYAGRYSDRIGLVVAVQNKGAKGISGLQGRVVFSDVFGKKIKEMNLPLRESFAANSTQTISSYGFDLNQFSEEDTVLKTSSMMGQSWKRLRFQSD